MSIKGQKWLKAFHVWFSCLWVSAAMILLAGGLFLNPSSHFELYGYNMALKFIDDFIIIPAAMLTLITGVLYSSLTKWGWFKEWWIVIKWVITIGGILFGTFFLGPWLNSLVPHSFEHGLKSLEMTEYLVAKKNNLIFGSIQTATLIFALFISVLKPFGKVRRNKL